MTISRLPEMVPQPESGNRIPGAWAEEISDRWGVELETTCRFLTAIEDARCHWPNLDVMIISGRRTRSHEIELMNGGKGIHPDLSTHVSLADSMNPWTGEPGDPTRDKATGMDFDFLVDQDDKYKVFGGALVRAGLRWGGGSEFVGGMPTDRNHFDRGPKWAG